MRCELGSARLPTSIFASFSASGQIIKAVWPIPSIKTVLCSNRNLLLLGSTLLLELGVVVVARGGSGDVVAVPDPPVSIHMLENHKFCETMRRSHQKALAMTKPAPENRTLVLTP